MNEILSFFSIYSFDWYCFFYCVVNANFDGDFMLVSQKLKLKNNYKSMYKENNNPWLKVNKIDQV